MISVVSHSFLFSEASTEATMNDDDGFNCCAGSFDILVMRVYKSKSSEKKGTDEQKNGQKFAIIF